MTRTRLGVIFAMVVVMAGVAAFRTSGKSARAGEPADLALQADPFSEEESARRYAASQTRHWRQMLVKRN